RSGADAQQRFAGLLLAAEQVIALADEVPELGRNGAARDLPAEGLLEIHHGRVLVQVEEDTAELAQRDRREASVGKLRQQRGKRILRLLVEVNRSEALAEQVQARLAQLRRVRARHRLVNEHDRAIRLLAEV